MVLLKESNSLKGLLNQLNSQFVEVVNLILNSKGKVIITGIGKSAIISMKISSTLNSTGTSSVFLHAADAMHGDLGLVNPNDLVIIISNSGTSNEIKDLVPHLKKRGNIIISITGNVNSFLAVESDYLLSCFVEEEACPNNLAPTSSTTSQMALGDALAVSLLKLRGFKTEDFASHHPGGTLGRKLNLTLKDLASKNPLPKVKDESKINEVIKEITSNRLGITLVMKKDKLLGIITDGDIRRMLDNNEDIVNLRARDIMSKNPILFNENMLVDTASKEIKNKSINHMILTDKNNNCSGVVHVLDIIKNF
ncbi:MAG: D-arabinose 5-phosphate isomerase [Flavobacteriaceae bacterium]|nr:D-arabinose 5-phosphate isomerase [Flavobacteriaceae bacterium]